VTEPRAEQDGDRRVVAVAAAVVLLGLVVAAIVTVAAMAYRDDGKGGLLGTKEAVAGHAGKTPTPATKAGNAAAGAKVFADNCSGCHGTDGHGGNGGPDLSGADNLQAVITQVTNGGGGMPAFSGTLRDQQIRDVAAFVTQRVAK
jgi:cytochrome c6